MSWKNGVRVSPYFLVLFMLLVAYLTVMNNSTVQTRKGHVTWMEVNENVFTPMGYKISALTNPIPTLVHLEEPTCEKIFSNWSAVAKNNVQDKIPPRDMSKAEQDKYTLNGYALYSLNYYHTPATRPYHVWSMIPQWLTLEPKSLTMANYQEVAMSIYHAMQFHNLSGQSGFTVGSITPWLEVFALRAGAAHVLTVEYQNTTIIGNDQVTYTHPLSFAQNWASYEPFDFAASFSSIEHSGLQRYGDPADPEGDLREIHKIRCMLRPNGLLFLGLPRSQDHVVYNEIRIYGRIRLALMFTGFELVNVFRNDNPEPIELSVDDFDGRTEKHGKEQDTFVLRKL